MAVRAMASCQSVSDLRAALRSLWLGFGSGTAAGRGTQVTPVTGSRLSAIGMIVSFVIKVSILQESFVLLWLYVVRDATIRPYQPTARNVCIGRKAKAVG